MKPVHLLGGITISNLFILFAGNTLIGELTRSFMPYVTVFLFITLLFIVIFQYNRLKKSLLWTALAVLNMLIIVGWGVRITTFYEQVPPENSDNGQQQITVLVANIHHHNRNIAELKQLVTTHQPDILVFVEYSSSHHQQLQSFMQDLFPYSSVPPDSTDDREPYIRNALFSKFPLTTESHAGQGYYESVVTLPDDNPLTIFSVHTSAPISRHYFSMRNSQLTAIAKEARNCTTHCIIAGDFNLSPWSSYYDLFESSVKDSYTNKSRSIPGMFTWELSRLPILKSHIDHIWVTSDMTTSNVETFHIPGSDHDGLKLAVNVGS